MKPDRRLIKAGLIALLASAWSVPVSAQQARTCRVLADVLYGLSRNLDDVIAETQRTPGFPKIDGDRRERIEALASKVAQTRASYLRSMKQHRNAIQDLTQELQNCARDE